MHQSESLNDSFSFRRLEVIVELKLIANLQGRKMKNSCVA